MERAELPHLIARQHLLPRRQVGDRLMARWKDRQAPLAPACSTALRSAVLASMDLSKQGVVAKAAAAIAGAGGLRLARLRHFCNYGSQELALGLTFTSRQPIRHLPPLSRGAR